MKYNIKEIRSRNKHHLKVSELVSFDGIIERPNSKNKRSISVNNK